MIVTTRDIAHEERGFRAAIEAVMPLVGPQWILEAGTHDGATTVRLAHAYPGAKVATFEPDPTSASGIMGALRGAGVLGRTVFTVAALTSETGPTTLYRVKENRGASSLAKPSGGYDHIERYTVEAEIPAWGTRVDAWAEREGVPAIQAAWLDLQGGELEALRGFGRMLETLQVLQVETCYRGIYEGTPLWPELCNQIEAWGLRPVVRSELLGGHWGDAIFVREGWERVAADEVSRAIAGCPERP